MNMNEYLEVARCVPACLFPCPLPHHCLTYIYLSLSQYDPNFITCVCVSVCACMF